MDKNGRLFGKISIIDLFAVILVLGIIAGVVYRYASPASAIASGTETINYTLMVKDVREFTFEYYKKGLNCFDKKTNEYIGKITGARMEPYFQKRYDLDGVPRMVEVPNSVTIFVDIEAEGRITDEAFFINGTYKMRIGAEIPLITKYSNVIATVVKINDFYILVH